MRICVYGAGAVGGHIAGRLARAGAEVAVVARGAHLSAMQSRGLRIEAPDTSFEVSLAATEQPERLGPQDVVIVTVKAPALPEVGARLASLLTATTPVIFITNGVPWWLFAGVDGPLSKVRLATTDPGAALWRLLDEGRVVGGVVYSACTVAEPGFVRVAHDRNRLILGPPDGLLPEQADRIAALLSHAGFKAETSSRIRDHVWEKMASHLAISPLSLLAEATIKDTFRTEPLRAMAVAIWDEVAQLAQRLGSAIPPAETILARLDDDHKPSILQDFELGRALEIDAIYNASREIAQRLGLEMPIASALIDLANVKVGRRQAWRVSPAKNMPERVGALPTRARY